MTKKRLIKIIPLTLIVIFMGAAYSFGLYDAFSFEELKRHHQTIQRFVAQYPLAAPALFITTYLISVALSIPVASYLSITGGFLFPQPLSTIYVLIGATVGATCLFLAAKTALGNILRERAGKRLNKMRDGFKEDAASYLLFLRLAPIFPFWLVNLAPAFFGVSLKTYIWTTFVGIIPGAFVFTQAGTALKSVLETEGSFTIDHIFTTDIKIALIALAIFALLPVIAKKFRARSRRKKHD